MLRERSCKRKTGNFHISNKYNKPIVCDLQLTYLSNIFLLKIVLGTAAIFDPNLLQEQT